MNVNDRDCRKAYYTLILKFQREYAFILLNLLKINPKIRLMKSLKKSNGLNESELWKKKKMQELKIEKYSMLPFI